jgi:hypothetical protein
MSSRARGLIGAVLIVLGVALVAVPFALRSLAGQSAATSPASAPPLTAVERTTLDRDRSVVSSLPKALAEIPSAMADAARSKDVSPLVRSEALRLLTLHPELSVLLEAVRNPGTVANSLIRGINSPDRPPKQPVPGVGDLLVFLALPGVLTATLGTLIRRRSTTPFPSAAPLVVLLAGALLLVGVFAPLDNGNSAWSNAMSTGTSSSTVSAQSVEQSLATLEQVYDGIVPALQIAGAAGRQVLDPESALQRIAGDPHLRALNQLVTNFSALYGAGILITQEIDASPSTPAPPLADSALAWFGLVAGLALIGSSGGSLFSRRRATRSAILTRSTPLVGSALSAEGSI